MIQRNAGGPAPVVQLKHIEFALRAHIAGQAQRGKPPRHLAQVAAGVALKGLAVGPVNVAEQAHDPPVHRPPGQNGHGGGVGFQKQIALLHI